MSNYVEMWKDLGMDLETHDQLCQVLPTAFGDVYLSQENRPEGMGFWDFVVSEIHGIRPSELIEAQKKGQKVFGTFCVYVPDEVVFAANGIVTGLCGGSQFWVPDGEKVLPKSTCPLIKASVGARLGRTCPFFRIADMYVGETTCDGKKKAWEILGKDVPMYIMDMPQMKREKDIAKWTEEIAEFAKVVEEFTGNKITVESLNAAIKTINEKRKAMARVFAATKGDVIPISKQRRRPFADVRMQRERPGGGRLETTALAVRSLSLDEALALAVSFRQTQFVFRTPLACLVVRPSGNAS